MSSEPGLVNVQTPDYAITAVGESEEQIRKAFNVPDPKAEEAEKVKDAARELGKKGGEAAAKARREAKPIPDKPAPDKAEATTDDEPEAHEATEAEPEPKAKDKKGNPRHDPQARIQQLARERAAERQRADDLERRLMEMQRRESDRQGAQPAREQANPAAQAQDEAPKEEDFASYSEYTRAAARYEAKQEWERLEREKTQKAEQERYVAYRRQQIEDARARFEPHMSDPDIAAIVQDDRFTPAHVLYDHGRENEITADSCIGSYILTSENGPTVARYLLDHPDDYQRVATLEAPTLSGLYEAVQREMARIEYRSAAATEEPARAEISKAKPPVKPLAGSPNTADAVPGEDASYDAHYRYMQAKEKRLR